MKVYSVSYWDPCNGMQGRSENRGLFATRELAQSYVEPRIQGKDNWDKNAYTIHEIEVAE